MRSVNRDDLTLRARIRDAAVELFAQRGFERATIREIAERAGASPALVVHHFGSKEDLRETCDEHVVRTLLADRDAVVADPSAGGVAAILSGVGVYRVGLDYLARLMTEPTDAGARMFDLFLEHTREVLREGVAAGSVKATDPDRTALLLTAYGLAPLVLQSHFARALGVDPLSPEGARILAVPGLELLTRGIYRDDALLRATEEALDRGMGPRSDKGDGDPNQDPDPPTAAKSSDPTT